MIQLAMSRSILTRLTRADVARSVRERIDESCDAALFTLPPIPVSVGLCRCGAPLDDPTMDVCGPCGRDQGER